MKYDIIVSDPPWNQTKGNLRKSRPNQGKKLDYETLGIEDIKGIHRNASLLTTDSHNFFVWTIDKYLHECEKMMIDLGYSLHARMIWDKTNGVAPAFTLRFSHEYLLWFYKKGKMLMPCQITKGVFTTVFREKSTKHSKKPNISFEIIEAMFPSTQKLEMFARNEREGWDVFGNEVENSIKL